MHRLIMTSTVYRQSSRREPAKDASMPTTRCYGRYPVRRLDAEALRDRDPAASAAGSTARRSGRRSPVVEDAVGQVGPAERLAAAERLSPGAPHASRSRSWRRSTRR